MHGKAGAIALGAAGIGVPSLMWALDHMGLTIPYGAIVAVAIASGLLLLWSAVMWCRIGAAWLRTKGRPRLAPVLVMYAGVAIVLGGYVWYLVEDQKTSQEAVANVSPSPQEVTRRVVLLDRLRHEYILSHDGLSPALVAGTEPPPADWINQRLMQLGESWRVPLRVTAPAERPSVLLLPAAGQLDLFNKGKSELLLWGDRLEGFPPSIEKDGRIIPAVDGFYYFLTDQLKATMLSAIGKNGERLFPFEVYLSDEGGRRWIAKFALLVKMKDGQMEVHTQQLGVSEGNWETH